MPEKEQAALAKTSKGRGLKRTSIQEGQWHYLMDVVKSRLTGSSRASDISFLHVSSMNGIMNGKVYDWSSILAEHMHEFMTLHHRTFYMPHYAIGLFLDARARIIPIDKLEAKLGPLALGEPLIMQWKHLDVASGQKSTVGQKRPRIDTGGDTNSDRQDTSSEESSSEEEEKDDEEVEVISATPLLFPQPVLSATAHLVPVSTHMAHIPGFRQFKQPIMMTSATVAVPPPVVPKPVADVGAGIQVATVVPEEEMEVMELPA